MSDWESGKPEDTRHKRLVRLRDEVLPKLQTEFGQEKVLPTEHRDELSVTIPKELLRDVVRFLKNSPDMQFAMLKDIHVVDWNRKDRRFEVIYNLYSYRQQMRIRVKCLTEESDPHVDSIVEIHKAADWYEREAYDMHGVIFDDHPDLRRMYMPEDFVHPETGKPLYPLRKEFPMMGVPGSLPMPERGTPREAPSNGSAGTERS
jgi:NADH-quinone oxidoreductase subunit C